MVAPLQRQIISCLLWHCEREEHVVWCKLEDLNCKPVRETEHVKISSKVKSRNERISYLEFKSISMDDNGQYRCQFPPFTFGHFIWVNVSERYANISHANNITRAIMPISGPGWMPYVYISGGIVPLVAILIIISFLSAYGCEGLRWPVRKRNQEQEMSTLTLPAVPKGSLSPSAPHHSLPDNFYDNSFRGVHGLGTSANVQVTYSPAPPSKPAAVGQWPDCLVYAALDHLPTGMSPRPPPRSMPPQGEPTEYAAVRFY